MSTILPALAASLISAGAALSGVALSNRHNLRRHREVLREEALKAQRELVADTVLAGREWANLQLVLVPMMSKFSHDDLVEFVDTDSGVRLREVTKDLAASLTRANLFIEDEELRKIATTLSEFIENVAETINGPILNDPAEFDHVLSGIREITRFRNTLRHLEDLAVRQLASPIRQVANR